MEGSEIDGLLERYLQLLHEYTALRAELNGLQTAMYQNIARANFSAERGMRFGPDFYDDRMQAERGVGIRPDDRGAHCFSYRALAEATDAPLPAATGDKAAEAPEDGDPRRGSAEDSPQEKPARKKRDPLHWFGLLTPTALRQAQVQSTQAVERVLPKLVSVNYEMAQVEIEVRRARKRRAKAEAAATKKPNGNVAHSELTA